LGRRYQHKNPEGSVDKEVLITHKDGVINYSYQYVKNSSTGELDWGRTKFEGWDEWMDFLTGKISKKPRTRFRLKNFGGGILTLNSIAKFFSTITKTFSKCTQISTLDLNLGHC
jgi:hypothetical protein